MQSFHPIAVANSSWSPIPAPWNAMAPAKGSRPSINHRLANKTRWLIDGRPGVESYEYAKHRLEYWTAKEHWSLYKALHSCL